MDPVIIPMVPPTNEEIAPPDPMASDAAPAP